MVFDFLGAGWASSLGAGAAGILAGFFFFWTPCVSLVGFCLLSRLTSWKKSPAFEIKGNFKQLGRSETP